MIGNGQRRRSRAEAEQFFDAFESERVAAAGVLSEAWSGGGNAGFLAEEAA